MYLQLKHFETFTCILRILYCSSVVSGGCKFFVANPCITADWWLASSGWDRWLKGIIDFAVWCFLTVLAFEVHVSAWGLGRKSDRGTCHQFTVLTVNVVVIYNNFMCSVELNLFRLMVIVNNSCDLDIMTHIGWGWSRWGGGGGGRWGWGGLTDVNTENEATNCGWASVSWWMSYCAPST